MNGNKKMRGGAKRHVKRENAMLLTVCSVLAAAALILAGCAASANNEDGGSNSGNPPVSGNPQVIGTIFGCPYSATAPNQTGGTHYLLTIPRGDAWINITKTLENTGADIGLKSNSTLVSGRTWVIFEENAPDDYRLVDNTGDNGIWGFIFRAVQAEMPQASPQAGEVASGQQITLSNNTSWADIYYTTDGSTPTAASALYSGDAKPVITAATTLKAIAVQYGRLDSQVMTAVYTVDTGKTAMPSASPQTGAVTIGTQITLTCGTQDAAIYYTTDGSTPTTASAAYSDGNKPVISAATTLKAIAVTSGMTNSDVMVSAYTIAKTAIPEASPQAGEVANGQQITLTSATQDAVIYYTTSGSTPTTASTLYSDSAKPVISAACTLKAIAVKSGMIDSDVLTASYTLTAVPKVAMPSASPAASTVSAGTQITLTCGTPGAAIYYTTDGSTPTTASTLYSDSAKPAINAATTIKAIAVMDGMTNSYVMEAAYTVLITYTAYADGSATAASTRIYFTFSQPVSRPTASQIIIGGSPGAATKGVVSGGDKWCSIYITPTVAGAATVSINKSGIESGAKSITLYTQPAITYTAQANGSATEATSTKIDFVFSEAVTGLTKDDITIDGPATKGTLTGSGKNWSLPITTTAAGAATVSINKSGSRIENTAKSITLHKILVKWVAVAANRKLAVSVNGTTWVKKNSNLTGDDRDINSVAYGNGWWLAVANYFNAYGTQITRSRDGENWTARTIDGLGAVNLNAVAYGNGRWVAAGRSGKLAVSTDDGSTWTLKTSGFDSAAINAVAYGNGRWVAAGDSGKLIVSTDNGETWAQKESGFGSTQINAVAYGNGRWVAVGRYGKLAVSTNDGETWTQKTSGFDTTANGNIYSVAYGGGRWFAGGSLKLAVSTDNGDTWTLKVWTSDDDDLSYTFGSHAPRLNSIKLAYGNEKWFAAGGRYGSTSTAHIYKFHSDNSLGLINCWTSVANSFDSDLGQDAIECIAYGGE